VEGSKGAPKQRFVANLFTLRTLLIFAAGFALALLLARTLPGASLFHPEARLYTKDIVITALNGPSVADIRGIATETGEGFGGDAEVWDADLLDQAVGLAQPTNSFRLPARITYVVPSVGPVTTLRIEPRD